MEPAEFPDIFIAVSLLQIIYNFNPAEIIGLPHAPYKLEKLAYAIYPTPFLLVRKS